MVLFWRFKNITMSILLNGAFMLGLMYSISALMALWMTYFLYKIPKDNKGLRAILLHLFIAWCLHYLIIGVLTLSAFFLKHEIVPLNTLRLFAATFVLLQLSALIRVFFYTKK